MIKKNPFEEPTLERETAESLSAKLLATTSQLIKANEELKRMEKERSEMLANISHDLRAPITAIRSAVDYLTSGKNLTKEDYNSSLGLIDRRTLFLENLIQDMYYLFCVEDTSKELTLETIPAAAFLEEYFYDAIVDTRYDEYQMHLNIAANVLGSIQIDIQKIVRVLDNLFTNAAKYSPKGTDITLKCELTEDSRFLFVKVIDNGIGIPEENLPQLFNRTYTVSSARTPGSEGGTGLGLSIVKAIIERHQGTVSCESKEGKGSCFSFTLPYIS